MAWTFYPRKTRFVPASEPHIAGTEYKISVGDEDWGNGMYQPVVKVQMFYDGKVAGRKSPFLGNGMSYATKRLKMDNEMKKRDEMLHSWGL